MKKGIIKRILGALLISTAMSAVDASAAASETRSGEPSKEYQIKAAFVFKFLSFIDWPKPHPGPKVICIYGDNPFGSTIEQLIAVSDPTFTLTRVREIDEISELKSCDLVYIGQSERTSVLDVLEAVQHSPVVTVSDIDYFTRAGGTIELVLEGGKVRFLINPQPAQEAGVKISSQLLSLAKNSAEDLR